MVCCCWHEEFTPAARPAVCCPGPLLCASISACGRVQLTEAPRGCAQPTIGEVLCGAALLSAVITVVLGFVVFLTVGVWLIVR